MGHGAQRRAYGLLLRREGVDPVAHADVADDALADLGHDVGHIARAGELHGAEALAALDPGRATNDTAADVGALGGLVRIEEGRPCVQPPEADGARVEAQRLVVLVAVLPIPPPHGGAGRPDDFDGVGVRVEAGGADARSGAEFWSRAWLYCSGCLGVRGRAREWRAPARTRGHPRPRPEGSPPWTAGHAAPRARRGDGCSLRAPFPLPRPDRRIRR